LKKKKKFGENPNTLLAVCLRIGGENINLPLDDDPAKNRHKIAHHFHWLGENISCSIAK
jgi:hypothetical protein